MYIYIPEIEPDKVRLFGSIAAAAKGLNLSPASLYNCFTRQKETIYKRPEFKILRINLERSKTIEPGPGAPKKRPMKKTKNYVPPEKVKTEWFTK